jgi:CAAX prenyl protease-like protein
MIKKITNSTLLVRIVPFLVFLGLTALQGRVGPASAYWLYAAKTLVGLWFVWLMRPFVTEMRWSLSWEAIVVGVIVCITWVALDPFYPHLKTVDEVWNPFAQFGRHSALAWGLVAVRVLGSTFVVPPLEEVFYRSFVYRYIASQNFLSVPLNKFLPLPFIVTAVIFGIAHYQWLAGIFCGAAFQWLVLRRNHLGDAMTAHAVTNLLLGAWVIWKSAWQFW